MTARRLPTAILVTALAFLIALGACASSLMQAGRAAPTQSATPAPTEAPRTTVAVKGQAVPPVRTAQAPDCSRKLQSLVDEAAPSAVVSVPACVYRETVTVTKPIALVAEPGAEIRGSDVWSDWTQTGRPLGPWWPALAPGARRLPGGS